jgi:membrane protein
VRVLSETRKLLRETILSFIEDEALSRGAAIAFYTVTSIAPVLLIVIAIAGLAFGEDAAENAIVAQLSDLMGPQTAEVLQSAVASAASKSSGTIATIIGVITLMVAASGVFAEMQSTLNAIWKAELKGLTLSRLIRARAASLGLVAALGLLLIVSLAVSAALTAFGNYLDSILPFGEFVFPAMHFIVSLLPISVLFTVIYKALPDRHLEWRDVVGGGVVTAVLFNIGKSLIGWYIGSSAVASSYGAAGASIVLILWIYYSTQLFLLGAEFTKAYANRHGVSKQNQLRQPEIQQIQNGLCHRDPNSEQLYQQRALNIGFNRDFSRCSSRVANRSRPHKKLMTELRET